MQARPVNIMCVSRYFKGNDLIEAAHKEGHKVYMVTSSNLKDKPWPWDCLEEVYYLEEDKEGNWNMDHLIAGLAYQFRKIKFDIFISLDDFDVEIAALMREYFRVPGMGDTTARYFRDKLAMRMKAKEEGIPVPAFTALFHDADIEHFTQAVSPPWLIKPRGQASATGIQKIHSAEELWSALEKLGGDRHKYLLEKFAPGSVYHVDSLTSKGEIVFSMVSKYLDTPFEVAHGGGIFRSVTLEKGSKDEKALQALNEKVMQAFGMEYSASHTEFIKGNDDGKYYFLETSSRVGGAHLSDMVEAASGINLWAEWAKIEVCSFLKKAYKLPKVQKKYGGIIVSLSRFPHPDTSSFTDPEIVWKLDKKDHIGFIVTSDNPEKIRELLDKYMFRIKEEFHASMPAPDRPTS
jgi:D-alanine-D-alanine ligase-like ATP-grasp enzyme